MIQFNLLPDVKMKYIKARLQKRMVMLIASLAGVGALSVLGILLVYVYVVQGSQISSFNKKIKTSQSSISTKNQQVDDINKVLTVQNQLRSLDSLHADKPVVSRIFDYLAKITPSNITIAKLYVTNSDTHVITMQGSTDTLESVNKFVDTLKFTTYKSAEKDAVEKQIFTSVVLSTFGRDKAGASYSLNFTYDPLIFASTSKVSELNVPNKVTTRSELGRPILQSETEKLNNAPDTTGSAQ
jgi:Tfp pilus assembly protein PilN